MIRDNKTWLAQLGNNDPDQQLALTDLRIALLQGLHKAFATRTIDESFLEDTVQDSLLLILDRLHQFEGRSRFTTWAISIAIRVAMSNLRRKQWKDISLESVIGDTDFTYVEIADENSEPEIHWRRNALFKKMHTLIQNSLTEKQKIALLAELREIPQDEIARHLGSNRNAVYKLTHDARKKLKLGLEAAGYQVADINAVFTHQEIRYDALKKRN